MRSQIQIALGILVIFIAVALVFHSCKPGKEAVKGEAAEAALATYVPPGDLDEFYLFYSGGHSGGRLTFFQLIVKSVKAIASLEPTPISGIILSGETILGFLKCATCHAKTDL